ncbi:MAG: amino acid ABC transporter substrate-binding protein [Clostridia bacterium]|nr:amino acid ABC transporter substrate-binding protein [Clostridia bacterium]
MKKLFAFLMTLVLVFSFAALAEEDNSLKAIQEKGYLILGLDDSFPPMGFNDENGNIVGFDIDLAAEVCKRLGVELKTQPIDWAAKEALLDAGNIDCIWNGMSITPARQEAMCMTEAYLNNCIVILTKKDSGIEKVEDLAGKYVAVQGGSFAEEVLTIAEYGYQDVYASIGEVITEADYLYAIMNLKNGMVDAVLIDEVVAEYELSKLNDDTLICVGNLCDDLYGIGFRKADAALMNAVYSALIDMAKDGTAAKIAANWFSTDIVTPVLLKGEQAE